MSSVRSTTRLAPSPYLSELGLLQTAVTVLIAAVLAAGALLASQASSGRQEAVRQEIKRMTATVEDVRYVYGDEAFVAFRITVAETRADELQRAARAAGSAGDLAKVEATVQAQAAFMFTQAEEGTGRLADGNRYRMPDGGFDVVRRLADVRAQNPELVGIDPDATQAAADRRGRAARTLTATIAVLVVAYLVVGLVGSAQRRRSGRRLGSEADPGLIPQPWSTDSVSRRHATTVGLLAWLLITLLSGPQVSAADEEQQGQSLAARLPALIATGIAASGLHQGFAIDSLRSNLTVENGTLAREFGALDVSAGLLASEKVIVTADRAAATRIQAVATRMTRLPNAGDGVDPATRAALAATPTDWEEQVAEQNRQAERAERAGQRNDRLIVALLLGALASSLAAIAAQPRAPAVLLYPPVALLIGGVAIALSAFVA